MTRAERMRLLWKSEDFRAKVRASRSNRRPWGEVKAEMEERLKRKEQKRKEREQKRQAREARRIKREAIREYIQSTPASPVYRSSVKCSFCGKVITWEESDIGSDGLWHVPACEDCARDHPSPLLKKEEGKREIIRALPVKPLDPQLKLFEEE